MNDEKTNDEKGLLEENALKVLEKFLGEETIRISFFFKKNEEGKLCLYSTCGAEEEMVGMMPNVFDILRKHADTICLEIFADMEKEQVRKTAPEWVDTTCKCCHYRNGDWECWRHSPDDGRVLCDTRKCDGRIEDD